jgi:uncharacterized repeat protein (TIGR03803 family)
VFNWYYTLLYSLGGNPDGKSPQYGRLVEYNGAFYGTTAYGGAYGQGAIVQITPGGAEQVLYSFGSHAGDGSTPVAGLTVGKDNKLYGTTNNGGANNDGTVFVVSTDGTQGGTTETVLYSFQGTDGQNPQGGLLEITAGHFYGTTTSGGANGAGVVYTLATDGTAVNTTQTVLYNLTGALGTGPQCTLVMASDGKLYGTTFYGGIHGKGAVFSVTTDGTAVNTTVSVLYSFGSTGVDGSQPLGGLIQASDGALYGTTTAGGAHGAGTVYKITLSGLVNVVYSFGSQSGDGQYPQSVLVQASDGNFYGTTTNGGAYVSGNSGGTVFEVTPAGGEAVLHSFAASGDGDNPIGGLTIGSDGYLYGTTSAGGSTGNGTVFQIK